MKRVLLVILAIIQIAILCGCQKDSEYVNSEKESKAEVSVEPSSTAPSSPTPDNTDNPDSNQETNPTEQEFSILGDWYPPPAHGVESLIYSEWYFDFTSDNKMIQYDIEGNVIDEFTYTLDGNNLTIRLGDTAYSAVIANYRGFYEIHGVDNDFHAIREKDYDAYLSSGPDSSDLIGMWLDSENSIGISFHGDNTFEIVSESFSFKGTYEVYTDYSFVSLTVEEGSSDVSSISFWIEDGAEYYYLISSSDYPLGNSGPFNYID